MEMAKVLVVDDNALVRSCVGEALEDLGHTLYSAWKPEQAIGMLYEYKPDTIVSDLHLEGNGDAKGLLVIAHAFQANPYVKAVLITASENDPILNDYPGLTLLSKPFGYKKIKDTLKAAKESEFIMRPPQGVILPTAEQIAVLSAA